MGSGRPFFISDAKGACSVADRAATVPVCHNRRSKRTRNSGRTTSRCTPAATRWVHLTSTLTGLTLTAYGLARGRKRYLAALPLIGYGTAWPAHFLIEKNNPATFGHPLWSLRGDAQMIRTMLAGRDAELAETAAKWLAEHGEDGEERTG